MGNKWFVKPEVTRLDSECDGEPFWIEVKNNLTIGEKRRLETAGFRGMSGMVDAKQIRPGDAPRSPEIGIDWRAMSFARTETWLTDWSLADDHDNKIPLTNKREVLEALRPEVYEAIENAISKHVDAQAEAKKPKAGSLSPSAISA